jgi:predicted GNAT family acetyltransferase
MSGKFADIPLTDNKEMHNFEFIVDNKRSFIDYVIKHDHVYLIHTEVAPELEGQGVASAMVTKTLEYIEGENRKIVPRCSYVLDYLERHPEWKRLVANY